MKVYEIITEKFIEALNEGVIPWRMPWDKSAFSHQNLKTKSEYSGVNVFILMLSMRKNKFTSPHWLTFNQAKSMGGRVKKGSKSTAIVFWRLWEKKDPSARPGEVSTKDKAIPVIRYYNVFNADQVEGVEVPTVEKPQRVNNPIETAEKIVSEYTEKPDIQWTDETRAFYSPLADYINMPKREYFHTPEEVYSTLFHELTHSTGHESRLKRHREGVALHGSRGDYSREELTAELGSAFLCHEAGIDQAVIVNQKAYIQSWAKALKDDPRMIVEASGKAQKAVNYMRGIKKAGK